MAVIMIVKRINAIAVGAIIGRDIGTRNRTNTRIKRNATIVETIMTRTTPPSLEGE
jgi:hypothetical protein